MTVNNENRHIVYDIVNDYFSKWLNNSDGLTEIAVNRPGELFTKIKGRWKKEQTTMSFQDCLSFSSSIADYHDDGSITPEYPLRSATLPDGERVQIVIPPATEKETVSITIRKPSSVFLNHDHFVEQGFYSRLNAGEVFEKDKDNLSEIYRKKKV